MTALFTPIRVSFPIAAVPKSRPRVMRSGVVFTPAKTKNFETELQWCWRRAGLSMAPKVPLHVTVGLFFVRPKSTKKTILLPIVKPDLDNCAKAILDALNGFAWDDDSQVTDLQVYKRYLPAGESARIDMVIAPVIIAGVA